MSWGEPFSSDLSLDKVGVDNKSTSETDDLRMLVVFAPLSSEKYGLKLDSRVELIELNG